MKKILFLPFIILFSACSTAPVNEPEPKPVLAGEELISTQTSDKVTLEGSIFYPKGFIKEQSAGNGTKKYPAVVLYHMWNRNRYEWLPLIPRLQDSGYVVIAFNLRVNSSRKRKVFEYTKYLRLMSKDALACYDYLKAREFVDLDNIHIVGASIGTTLGIKLTARLISDDEDPQGVRSLTLISPAVNYFAAYVDEDIEICREIPMYFVLEKFDPKEKRNSNYKSGMQLYEMFEGKKKLTVYEGVGHGTKMLAREELLDMITAWIKDHSKP
ncbi:MAG: alpha/beta fold hydrolase [Endomicrobiales bacterium]|nr:alpha/beta fold hydrolase [Endomicrobiales bacterium]